MDDWIREMDDENRYYNRCEEEHYLYEEGYASDLSEESELNLTNVEKTGGIKA